MERYKRNSKCKSTQRGPGEGGMTRTGDVGGGKKEAGQEARKEKGGTVVALGVPMKYNYTSGRDAHATTLSLFNMLSSYPWDAKVVLVLAAFAVNHGEFWLTVQLQTVNPLAKSMSLLKQVPDIIEHTDVLKPRFDTISNLIKAMLDVTNCIIEFKELPSEYISPDSPDMSMAMAHIPTDAYWTVRSAVACATQITMLMGPVHV
ncbi:putative protein SIEVE ELEMENT OCCLUSION C [Cocos nucifera]|nr:putative protein SIEVE ELEMENT OCCLUSION C [Cocos nucifera]